jgi:DNA-binding MarR family transcriptional regulator
MTGPAAAAVKRDRAQDRPAPIDTDPSQRLGDVLDLLDDLALVTAGTAMLFRGIEQVTGLRVGEVQVLLAVAHGADQATQVASRTGQPDDAALATITGLVDSGLLRRHVPGTAEDGGESAASLRLTDSGTAAFEQAEAVRIRLLGMLVAELGREGVEGLRAGLRALARVFEAEPAAAV